MVPKWCPATNVRAGMTSDRSRVIASNHLRSNLSSQMQIRALHSERKLSDYDSNGEDFNDSQGLDSTSNAPMSQSVTDNETPSRAAALSLFET